MKQITRQTLLNTAWISVVHPEYFLIRIWLNTKKLAIPIALQECGRYIFYIFCAWPPIQPNPRLYCSRINCNKSTLFIREQYTMVSYVGMQWAWWRVGCFMSHTQSVEMGIA